MTTSYFFFHYGCHEVRPLDTTLLSLIRQLEQRVIFLNGCCHPGAVVRWANIVPVGVLVHPRLFLMVIPAVQYAQPVFFYLRYLIVKER